MVETPSGGNLPTGQLFLATNTNKSNKSHLQEETYPVMETFLLTDEFPPMGYRLY